MFLEARRIKTVDEITLLTGAEVITRFAAEDLLVAGRRYFTVNGPLPLSRWTESHMNTGYGEKVATAAESNGQPVR